MHQSKTNVSLLSLQLLVTARVRRDRRVQKAQAVWLTPSQRARVQKVQRPRMVASQNQKDPKEEATEEAPASMATPRAPRAPRLMECMV